MIPEKEYEWMIKITPERREEHRRMCHEGSSVAQLEAKLAEEKRRFKCLVELDDQYLERCIAEVEVLNNRITELCGEIDSLEETLEEVEKNNSDLTTALCAIYSVSKKQLEKESGEDDEETC